MPKYRKTTPIEAYKITEENLGEFRSRSENVSVHMTAFNELEKLEIETKEGRMRGYKGDFLAVGAHGELYPIAREIFFDTYVLAEEPDQREIPPWVHPSTASVMKLFNYRHLPPHLQEVSKRFCDLAHDIIEIDTTEGPEITVALRELRRAKDSAVFAAGYPSGT